MTAVTTVSDTVFRCGCEQWNAPGSRFCSGCGRPLLAVQSLNELTCALFLDVEFEPVRPGIPVKRDLSGRAELVVCRGALAERRFALTDQPTTLGRAPESGIRLDEITISRRHAHLAFIPEGYLIRDLGSLNGTYVNGERVEERILEDGDEVRIGGFLLVFHAAAPGGPLLHQTAGRTAHQKRPVFRWRRSPGTAAVKR